jgi:hypothetical protein
MDEPKPGEVELDAVSGILFATEPPDGHRVIDVTLADYVGGAIHVAGPDDAALVKFVYEVLEVLDNKGAPGLWARDPMFGHRMWIPRAALERAVVINPGYMKKIHPSARRSTSPLELSPADLEALRGRRG